MIFDQHLRQHKQRSRVDHHPVLQEIRRRLEDRLQDISKKFDVISEPEVVLKDNLEVIKIDAQVDCILNHSMLHAMNDVPGALIQMRKALPPDGLVLGSMCGGETWNELRQSLMEAEMEVTGGVSPRVFPFVDIKDAGALLQRAGFALPVVDYDEIIVSYDDIYALMRDLRTMGESNILTERLRHPTRRSIFERADEIYKEKFSDKDGQIRATFHILYLTGWSPHESQQQPLKPGSAENSLAEALGK